MRVVLFKLKSFIALILVGVITAVLCVGVIHIKEVSASMKNGYKIVIDAGHGGIDGGVVGIDKKTKESTLNLYLSKILANELSRRGYKITMTRKTDAGLYSINAQSKKLSDMQKRKEIINETQPDLVVSIHQNYYPSSSVCGAQVFYSDSQEKSKEYATTLQENLNEFLSQNKQCKQADYYVLECSMYPSLLVECCFMSNSADLEKMKSATYREKFAKILSDSIDKILLKT